MTLDGGAVLYAAARWLGYLAAFLLMGAAVLRQVVLPRARVPAGDVDRATGATARLGLAAGLALLLALAARLYWQTRSLLDPGEPVTAEFLELVLTSDWGRGWHLQLGAALLGSVGWAVALRSAWERRGAAVASAGAILVAIAAPFTGHAVALPEAGRLGPALDALHFAAGGVWLGTLGTIVLVALGPAGRLGATRVRDVIAAFSPVALVAGAVVSAAGLVLAWRYLGGLAALWSTGYGRTLLVKLGAVAAVAALGAYNWRVVLPRLRRDGDPALVRRTARFEALLGLLLLAITAVLVALPAPGEH